MKYPSLLCCLFLLLLSSLRAQSGDYQRQIRVIESMLADGNYRAARAQAQARVESGVGARLPELEGRGRFLLGRILTENPAGTPKERIAGIRELRLAATELKRTRAATAVDSILQLLTELTGSNVTEVEELPSVKALRERRRTDLPDVGTLDEATLNAIVALQDQEITALTDSQLRQVLLLERKDRELDALAFQALNDSLQMLQQDRALRMERTLLQGERQRRNFLLLLAGVIALLLGVIYFRYRSSQRYRVRLEKQNAVIREERQRSEELLLNILPVTVAAELKETGKATVRRYDAATVMFSDFKGFSALAAQLPPEQLIGHLDEAFRAFDEIVARHGVEKIKTIGDAYMCVGGLPLEIADHAIRTVRAALEMQAYLRGHEHFAARIGIHTGPVVAGVVGKHKFVYDIWGDTVNQASRLEVAGEAGRVAISRAVRDALGEEFICTPAGTFQAKNIGELERFFVVARETSRALK
ncbi:MAG: adenylate/guanylate cyclase domain-containing protein [Bacteroidota bacterium]